MITVSNLRKDYGALTVIRDLSLTINKGDVVSIIGPPEAGKSTLLRCLNMLERPTSGSVVFEGAELTDPGADLNLPRRKMGMVFQAFNLFSHLSVLDNLTVGPVKLLGKSADAAEARARELLATVGMEEKADRYPDELSGGQMQRAAIARCLSMDPEIILFDKPTSSLDPTMVGEVTAVIRRLAGDGMTMVIVTHEMEFCRTVSTRVLYMDEGGIYEEGTPEKIFGSPERQKTRAFLNQSTSFQYSVASRGFDFIAMMNDLTNFCAANAVSKAAANKLQLVIEETVMNLILPWSGSIELSVGIPGNQDSFLADFTYGGLPGNVFDREEDDLAATMVRSIVSEIRYARDQNNHLHMRWNA